MPEHFSIREYLYRIAKVNQPQNSLIVAEFPKSGGTWFSLFLTDVLRQSLSNFYSSHSNVFDIDMRSLFFLSLLNPSLPSPTVLKTHRKAHYGMRNVIVLYRNLFDTYCSYFRFLCENSVISEIDFDRFVLHRKYGISTWIDFYLSYISLAKRFGHNVIFVSYESLFESFSNRDSALFASLLSSSGFNLDSLYSTFSFDRHFSDLTKAHCIDSYLSTQTASSSFRHSDYKQFLHYDKPNIDASDSSLRAIRSMNSRLLSLLNVC